MKKTISIILALQLTLSAEAAVCLRFPDTSLETLAAVADKDCDETLAQLNDSDSNTGVVSSYRRFIKRLASQKTEESFAAFFEEIQGQNWSLADQRILLQVLRRWIELFPKSVASWRETLLLDLESAGQTPQPRLKTEMPELHSVVALSGWEDLRILRNGKMLSEISEKISRAEPATWVLYSSAKKPIVFWGPFSELQSEQLQIQLRTGANWVSGLCRNPTLQAAPFPVKAVDPSGCVTTMMNQKPESQPPEVNLFAQMKTAEKSKDWVRPATTVTLIALGFLAAFALKDKNLVIRR